MAPKPRDRQSNKLPIAAPPSLVVNRSEPSTNNATTSQQHVFPVENYGACYPPYAGDPALKKASRMSRNVSNRKMNQSLTCLACPNRKSFATKTTLKVHINRMHTKKRMYPCSRKGCERAYGDAAGKSRCEKSHLGRYLCPYRKIEGCSFECKRSDGVRRHMIRRHHHNHYVHLEEIEFQEFENLRSFSSPTPFSIHSTVSPTLVAVDPESPVNWNIEDPTCQSLDGILEDQMGSYLLPDYGYLLPFGTGIPDSSNSFTYSSIF